MVGGLMQEVQYEIIIAIRLKIRILIIDHLQCMQSLWHPKVLTTGADAHWL